MSTCAQCGQAASFWHRDLWTGLCHRCRSVPGLVGRQTLKHRLAITIIILLTAVVVAIAYCTPIIDDLFLNRPFSSEDWLRAGVRGRGKMAGDLVSSGRLRKKTKAEVVEMLGPPDVGYGGSVIAYRVDNGYRIIAPRYSEVHILFEKESDIVYNAFLH